MRPSQAPSWEPAFLLWLAYCSVGLAAGLRIMLGPPQALEAGGVQMFLP